MGAWPTLDPGKMRTPIRVMRPTVADGVSGSEIQYEEVLSGYAEVEDDERGDEAKGSDQVVARERFVLRTWFDERVLSNMKIETDYGVWRIEQVVDVKKMRVVMRIFCIVIGESE